MHEVSKPPTGTDWILDRPIRACIRIMEAFVASMMAAVTIVVIAQVLLRWLAGTSLLFHEEMTRYVMIWIVMMGSALLIYEDGHIRISVLPANHPPLLGMVFAVVAQMITLIFLVLFIWASVIAFPRILGQQTVTLGISTAWFFAALPVGSAIMFLVALSDLVRTLLYGPVAPSARNADKPISDTTGDRL